MKKCISIILSIICILSLVGCTKDGETNISKDLIDAPYAKVEQEKTEWSIQEITSLFSDNAESDWKMVKCASVYDFAYDRVGVVLYTDSDTEHINIAFIDAEGFMQHCGVEAVLGENAEFTYHGNGEVTFNVCSKDGVKYKQKITFSQNNEGINFISESLE